MASAASLDSPQSSHEVAAVHPLHCPSCSSSPLFNSPAEKRFWSTLRSRVDMLLETRDKIPTDPLPPAQTNTGGSEPAKELKEDTVLLLRGFDSVAHTLTQLSANIDNALQGARDLAKPPTLTDILQSNLRSKESDQVAKENVGKEEQDTKCLKRKFDATDDPDDQQTNSHEQAAGDPIMAKMKRAKNLAISMATKAGSLAKDLKLIKSDLGFMQERCMLLEEENRRLRDGFSTGTRPEEDDLVRLQLETLLAEKSRLASENANLVRENQCLNQLVTYHQLNTQDLSASYEEFIKGMCLDFSSPSSSLIEDQLIEDDNERSLLPSAPKGIAGISASLDALFEKEQQQEEPHQSQAD